MRALVPALLLVGLLATLSPASSLVSPTGAFVTEDRVVLADLSLDTFCPGPATATLTLARLAGGATATRTVSGSVAGFPSPCDYACTDCTVPFDVVFQSHDGRVLLAGRGYAGHTSAWTLAGTWEEGYVTVHHGYVLPPLCDPCD